MIAALAAALLLALAPADQDAAGAGSPRLISETAMGDIRLGMTLDEARRAAAGAKFERASDAEGAPLVKVTWKPDATLMLWADEADPQGPIDWTKPIRSIETFSPAFHTAEGIRPGSLVRDVEKAYGKTKVIVESEIESRQFITFVSQPKGLTFRIDYTGLFSQGERVTRQYERGAKIFSIAITAPAQAEMTQAADPLVIGQTFTIASKILGETRRINVYAPPGHDAADSQPLPVLYMPDGGMAEDFLHVAGLVQVSVGNGTMRPFLLVGIENTERRRDMTGPTLVEEDKKIAPRVGGSAAFRAFIRSELMPAVRARYRVTEERAIVGESLAGLFVVETFFLEPDLFDTYIAFDPSLWWNRDNLLTIAGERLRASSTRSAKTRTLYVAASAEPELAEAARRLDAIVKQAAVPGLAWHYEPMPAEQHSTIYHPAALRAFRALFKPVR